MRAITLVLIVTLFACDSGKEEKNEITAIIESLEFDSKKWKTKQEDEYPFRPMMYKEVLYSDSIRTLSKDEVLGMLGDPDREENNHLYYRVDRNQIGSWTLNQRSLVIKFRVDNSVEWIKLHE